MAQNDKIDLQHYRDFENLEFFARQVVEGFVTGLHKSPFHGFSVEFSEHRIYNPGESVRNIDWKLYGRTDRLYTKRYEEETNLRCRLILDTSASMFYPRERHADPQNPNKILFSTVSILALINLFRKQRDAVGLSLFGNHELSTDARSTFQHHRAINTELLKVLESYDKPAPPQFSMADQLHRVAQQIHKRSLIIIFSDLFEMLEDQEAFFDALQHLKHQKHEIILFWTTDQHTELDFDFEARPYRFVDMESGESVKLNPDEVREAYRSNLEEFGRKLRHKCLQYKIDLVEADVAQGYYPVLQSYLIKRKRLF